MNAESTSGQVEAGLRDDNRADQISRRAILGAAVGGVAVAAVAASAASAAATLEPSRPVEGSDELQDVLRKYGSEFGAMRAVV